jgi:hypothetical protein
VNPDPEGSGRGLQLLHRQPSLRRFVPENSHSRDLREELSEQLDPFGHQLTRDRAHSRDVASWPGEALYNPKLYRVASGRHDDRNRRRRVLGGAGRFAPARHDNVNPLPDQFGS